MASRICRLGPYCSFMRPTPAPAGTTVIVWLGSSQIPAICRLWEQAVDDLRLSRRLDTLWPCTPRDSTRAPTFCTAPSTCLGRLHGSRTTDVRWTPTGPRTGSSRAFATSIEAMAADYLTEIEKRQPDGPYYLCGYSSGGLVAFEIARRLSESGDEVGLVGLFDTTMSPVRWPLRAWLSIIARRLARLAAALRATPIRTWPAKLPKSAERLRAMARHSRRRAFNRHQGSGKRSHRLRQISPRVLSRAAHAVLACGTRA